MESGKQTSEVKFQGYGHSCGSASAVNALKHFGIHVDEKKVIPVAGTTPPSRCPHCVLVSKLHEARECPQSSYWRCSCTECLEIKREWRKECLAGTDPKGLIAALRWFGGPYGLTATEYETESRHNAWQWLHGSLLHGRIVIVCLDRWSHWTLAFGSSGDRVSIFDPYPSKKNKAENGVFTLTKTELMSRWVNTAQWVGKEKRLYAISVGKS